MEFSNTSAGRHTHSHTVTHISALMNFWLVAETMHPPPPRSLFLSVSLSLFFFNSVCVCQATAKGGGVGVGVGGGGVGGLAGRGRCRAPRGEELSRRATPLRAAVALPDFPLIAFSWYLNPGPFGFWRPAQTPQSPQRPIQLPDPSLTP